MAKNTKQQEPVVQVTEEHLQEMKAELEERQQRQQEIAEEIDEARKLGDLSENDPYQKAMEKKEMNDARISELEEKIRFAVVVDNDADDNVITVGNRVKLVNTKSHQERVITVVSAGSGEADPREGKISTDTPIGQAVYNATYGSKVTVSLPSGEVEFKLEKAA